MVADMKAEHGEKSPEGLKRMSFKEFPPEVLKAMSSIAQALGGGDFHMTPIIVCDHCRDDSREAFPYYVIDENGREWEHLCNPCFDILGCTIDLDED